MRIAICDNDLFFRKQIKQTIYAYINAKRADAVIDEYDSGEELLTSKNKYSIIFLDYYLKRINGFETAKRIRALNQDSAIIFISAYTDFILDCFKVKTFRFLTKPLNTYELYAALDDYFFCNGNSFPIWVRNDYDTICIKTEDIYYIEADNKNCYIMLENNKIHCKKTMGKVYEILPKNTFCKINRAYVINFNYINSFNNDIIALNNGEQLHISRNYYKSFKTEYINFADPIII